ncbi:MAG: class I SAM-dependent methyltransferase [Candidatus Nitrohelix vancouverensis]|uniref:Class I SAM-dependent methyltransferase n=1 Tax=Candidatus Nitrohelix vancouverensis TaxID=2705534 RepID=A0A7T0C2D1_9BACT|nr:MAG: class I SAM-dependent methyltransferase [Candidatus Nitrohelix vancouverensis]
MLTIDPFPNLDDIKKYYPDDYHGFTSHHYFLIKKLKAWYWKYKVIRYSQFITNGEKILEVGCGKGDLLGEFRNRGFKQIFGLDFNAVAVQSARANGFEVHHGLLDTETYPQRNFNLIIIENLIEHVLDPLSFLQSCHELLDKGGLIVGETPNINSWDCKLFGKYWGGYSAPMHLYLLNEENIKQLAEKSGFKIRQIKNTLQPVHWALSIQHYIQHNLFKARLNNGRSAYFSLLLLFFIPISMFQSIVSNSSTVQFVLEKK